MSDRSERAKLALLDSIEQEIQKLEADFLAIWEREKTPRDRASGVLQRANEHFQFLGVSHDAGAPLEHIQIAFDECERGLLHPLFEPDAKRGRRRRPRAQMHQQSHAALAMEALIRGGETRQQAANKVAKVLKQVGYKFPSNSKEEWKTVAEWRDEVRRILADKTRKSEFYTWYDFDRFWLDQELSNGKDPAELPKQILSWLAATRS